MESNSSNRNQFIIALIGLVGIIIGAIIGGTYANRNGPLAAAHFEATREAEEGAIVTEIEVTRIVEVQLPPNVPIAINSMTDSWQPTGLIVNKGDFVRVRVVGGKWTVYRRELTDSEKSGIEERFQKYSAYLYTFPENSGEGAGGLCVGPKCPLEGFEIGALVGIIGNDDDVIHIGNEKRFEALESGELFLKINDNLIAKNNHGLLAVEVSVEER